MQFDLSERCRVARASIEVPPYPSARVRAAAQGAMPDIRRRPVAAIAAVTILSIGAIAAAATIATQTHIGFTHSGGMILSTSGTGGGYAIRSDEQIRAAAQHLDFPAILPAGLPAGTTPIQLFHAGTSVIAITYNLPGPWRRSHHLLYIFIANAATLRTGDNAPRTRVSLLLANGKMRNMGVWKIGREAVVIVSNGLTGGELARIKAAMQSETR